LMVSAPSFKRSNGLMCKLLRSRRICTTNMRQSRVGTRQRSTSGLPRMSVLCKGRTFRDRFWSSMRAVSHVNSLKKLKSESIISNCFIEAMIDLLHAHYQRPTIIQGVSWPVALSGRDIISIAKTGSGKTLGYSLPAIVHSMGQTPRRPGDGPGVLVLLPTRELAIQVEEVAREYCRIMNLTLTCCYGGAPKGGQASALRKGFLLYR
jgi:superfamily II DNA/RNA helicase